MAVIDRLKLVGDFCCDYPRLLALAQKIAAGSASAQEAVEWFYRTGSLGRYGMLAMQIIDSALCEEDRGMGVFEFAGPLPWTTWLLLRRYAPTEFEDACEQYGVEIMELIPGSPRPYWADRELGADEIPASFALDAVLTLGVSTQLTDGVGARLSGFRDDWRVVVGRDVSVHSVPRFVYAPFAWACAALRVWGPENARVALCANCGAALERSSTSEPFEHMPPLDGLGRTACSSPRPVCGDGLLATEGGA